MNSTTKVERKVTEQDFKFNKKKDDKNEKLTDLLFWIMIGITL
jgi:hypothetical protein